MNTVDMFVAVLAAIAVRDFVTYFVNKWEEKKHKERLRLFIEHLEDEEADDD